MSPWLLLIFGSALKARIILCGVPVPSSGRPAAVQFPVVQNRWAVAWEFLKCAIRLAIGQVKVVGERGEKHGRGELQGWERGLVNGVLVHTP